MKKYVWFLLVSLWAIPGYGDLPESSSTAIAPAGSGVMPYTWSIGLTDAYIHQQQNFHLVFNDQNSSVITEAAIAKRLDLEYFWTQKLRFQFEFLSPISDEEITSQGEAEAQYYHFPKNISFGIENCFLHFPVSRNGWIELNGSLGVEIPLAPDFSDYFLPFAEVTPRVSLPTGVGVKFGGRYSGVFDHGEIALFFGVDYRI